MKPRQIIAAYNKGRITATEASISLCEAALMHDVAGFVQDVPEEVLARLKVETQQLPFVSRVYHQLAVAGGTPIDAEERARAEAEEMERRAAGLRTWKTYFESVGRAETPPSADKP